MLELLQFSKLMTLWKRKKKTFGGQGAQQGGFEPKGLSPAFSAKSTPPLASWESGGAGPNGILQ
jgi:hypothetical protein